MKTTILACLLLIRIQSRAINSSHSPILLIIFNQPATVEMEMEHKKQKEEE